MKNIIFGLIILIVAINNSLAQTTDFRNFNWGDPMEKIRNEETNHLLSRIKNEELTYEDKLNGTGFKVLYIFNDNNKLISGSYISTKIHSDPELYYQNYLVFLKLLTEKYQNPNIQKETWNSSDPTYDKTNKKQGIADKNLNLYSVWNTNRSDIKITLISIGNTNPSLQIHYTTKSLDDLENQIDLKEALKKL